MGETIAALQANFPRFANAIRNGFYKIVLGKTVRQGLALRENQLGVDLADRAIHIVPTVAGRKNGGLGKVIAGIALIGLSMVTGGAAGALMATPFAGGTVGAMVGSMGLAMAVSGVSAMLAPEQKAEDRKESFTMSGPSSVIREGNIVPIAYGEVVTGGYMISGSVVINGPAGDLPPAVATNPNNGAGGSLQDDRIYGGNG
ncbi:hypothetical protein GIY56_00620 [Paracoccus sp. YIM 132242]|uniref:Tail assembly protein n=1 Tax=Paracoccus lichenicola TaxID=2665644 RepID=A0A6L6HI16_9RHOB|nr:tail assembly protein [Paracoccus lichenicola]MTD98786.1 hypothetical protein [Paracoccus lichenicola]